MLRSEGLAAAYARLQEARAIARGIESGRIPSAEISASMRPPPMEGLLAAAGVVPSQPAVAADAVRAPAAPPPAAASALSVAAAPPPVLPLPPNTVPPPPPRVVPATAAPPVFAGAAADAMLPARGASAASHAPHGAPSLGGAMAPPLFDPSDLDVRPQPSFLGASATIAGVVVAGLLVLAVVVAAVLSK
jgi:hypothetical protein